MHKKICFILFSLLLHHYLFAQTDSVKFYSLQNIGGAISTMHQYYFSNSNAGIELPEKKYASNTWLNLNYNYKHIVAGVQAEAFLPALQGYKFTPQGKEKIALTHYFAGYRSEKFEVTAGTFYEQFGNGLIFRSFEDRQLGIDNVMRGALLKARPVKNMQVKTFYGRQRFYFDYHPADIAGADMDYLIFSKDNDDKNISLKGGASFLYINQDSVATTTLPHKDATTAWALRTNFTAGNYELNAEYMRHSKVAYYGSPFYQPGSALLISQNFTTAKGIAASLVFRRLELAALKADYSKDEINNFLNYLPSLTKQHTWLVSSIYPAVADWKHEIGGQAGIGYTFKKNTPIGGKYGFKIFLNGSLYRDFKYESFTPNSNFKTKFFSLGGKKQYSDLNVTAEKRFNKNFKAMLAFISQYNLKEGAVPIKTKTLATEMLFKLSDKDVLRTELQHLWNDYEEKNWAAFVAEYTHGNLSVFISDLTNYQTKKIHYFNIGGSYTKNAHRIMLGFAKQRAGLLCVGGVCRFVPSYMGFTAGYNYNF